MAHVVGPSARQGYSLKNKQQKSLFCLQDKQVPLWHHNFQFCENRKLLLLIFSRYSNYFSCVLAFVFLKETLVLGPHIPLKTIQILVCF